MTKLATRETAPQRIAAIEHRTRALDAPVGSRCRRSPVALVLLAAVLAVTAVSVAERIEDSVIEAPVADAQAVTPANVDTSNVVATAVPSTPVSPLASAVLPSGTMALTLRDGAATITTGTDAPSIELATTTIGDLDVGALVDDVVIAQADDEVSYDWGDVTEWYRTAPDGIEHGYTIDAPLSDSDDLTVTVDVADGTPTLVDADGVSISRPNASAIWYRGLVAFDADGTDLPATMAVVDGSIELRVDTAGAAYPVTIDPVVSGSVTVSVAGVVRVTSEPAIEITQVTDSGRIGSGGGVERVSACPSGSLLIGLTVYQTSQFGNWLRSAIPLCRQVALVDGEVSLTGEAVTGPEFGNRFGSTEYPPLPAPVTGSCLPGAAVTGLSGRAGALVDNVSLACNVVNPDGTVGDATAPVGPLGGSGGSVASPVSCAANAFASGLQGKAGTDVDAIGLQCATVAIGTAVDNDRFGSAVDIDGDRMVASAPFADVGGIAGAGMVYVYERTGGVWVQTAEILSPSAEPSGGFGDAVALSPNGARIAVGESDRLGDLAEPGRLFVFELQEGNWNLLEGPVVAPTPVAGDGFGASLAWAGDDRLVIGAPFANGTGMVYDYAVGAGTFTPIDVSRLTLVPSAGDEFGFSVAVDERPGGGHRLIVGSPGWTGVGGPTPSPDIGAVQFLDDINGLGFVPRDLAVTSPLGPPVRLGGSVAVSGDRVAFGSSGGSSITGTLWRTENGGVSWIGETTVSVPKDPDTPNLSNRFVAVEGGTLALGVPGGGGSVSLFRYNGVGWPTSPSDTVQPSGVEGGDLFGWATALDRGTLVAGAPGDAGAGNTAPDSGAVYTATVPIVVTFTGAQDSDDWAVAGNWDVGVVPGPADFAIVPFGTTPRLEGGGSSTVAGLHVSGALTVAGRLDVLGDVRIGPRVLADGVGDGIVVVRGVSGAELVVGGDIDFGFSDPEDPPPDGELVIGQALDGVDGQLTLVDDASVSGVGTISNFGRVVKTGPGTSGLGSAVQWYSTPTSTLDVQGGTLLFAGGPIVIDEGVAALAGTTRVAAGAVIQIDDALVLDGSSQLIVEIAGPSVDTANYGRFAVAGTLTLGGVLTTDETAGYGPQPVDAYPVVQYAAADGAFSEVLSASFQASINATNVVLTAAPTGEDPVVPPTGLEFSVSTSNPAPPVGVSTIEIADLPASAFQGYGGRTSDYAQSDLQTLDLRADLGAPEAAQTPVADVTLADLALDSTPVTRRLLGTILLSEIPIAGGWSAALQPAGGRLLVEQSLTLLDVHQTYRNQLNGIALGDLTLTSNNLGSMSTYAALLAGTSVAELPVPNGESAVAYWCGQIAAAGLSCITDFGVTGSDVSSLTLPVLSFAGVDVETAALLGAPLVDAAGTPVDLSDTPIGDRQLGSLNLGVVPLASQPLVPSKSLPSFLPSTLTIPDDFRGVTLDDLGGAAPLAALEAADVGLATAPLSTLDLGHNPDSPLDDYLWAPPAAGASLLLSSEGNLPAAIASVPVADLGLDAPVLAVPLNDLVLPNGRTLGSYRVSELAAAEAPFGASPFGASPFGASPFGASPFGASPFGASPFGASPFGASPFGASPFGASPFGASPFGASPFGASPFGASPFGASPFGASPFGASPFGASPFGASPFGASPFGASPFGASPFGASPFGASPFGASPFGASPLSELGLAAPVSAIPLSGPLGGQAPLGSYLLSDLDQANFLFDLPLAPFVGWDRLDCNVIDCRQPYGFTIADGIAAGAFTGGPLTLGDVQRGLFGLTVADLVGAHPDFTTQALSAYVAGLGTLTLAGAEATDGLVVSNVPVELLTRYQTVTLDEARLSFSGWRLVDLVGLAEGLEEDDLLDAIARWRASNLPTASLEIGDLTRKLPVKDAAGAPITVGLGVDELWVDTLALSTVAKADPGLTVSDAWPLLRPLRLEHLRFANGSTPQLTAAAGVTTLGQLVDTDPVQPPSQLEGLLWGDIIGSAGTPPLDQALDVTVATIVGGFAGITLGEFLRAAQPISDQRTEQIDLRSIDLAEYGTGDTLDFAADLEVIDGNRPQNVRVVITLPDGSRYVPDSAQLAGGPSSVGVEPTRFGDTLVWQLANLQPDVGYQLTFEATSSDRIGTVAISGSAQIPTAGLFVQSSSSVEYVEAFEPNDKPSDSGITEILSDQIVLTQISTAADVDLFRFEVTEPGERIGAVLWNLPADYDLTIIGPAAQSLTEAGGRIFESVGDSQQPLNGGVPAATVSDAGQYQPPPGLSVIARSTRRGTSAETIEPIPTFTTTGDYYLVVSGYDGASNDQPYGLRLLRETPPLAAPVCGAPTTFPNAAVTGRASATAIPQGTNTLFVVNDARFARQYGASAADDVLAAIAALDGTLSGLGLTAGVLDLGGRQALTAPYAAWDVDPCRLDLANAVVGQTISELRSVYAANPGIEYVVMVGSDKIIPFARLADRTLLGNEQNYASTFSGDRSSPLYAALQAGTYFSDDPYVDPTPNLVNDRALYVVEKSIGRLVEDPASIIGQLESFVDRGGTVKVDSAVVTGYDFLDDSSTAIAGLLEPVVGSGNVDTLISEDWTSSDLEQVLFPASQTGTGLGAINGHFSHQGTQSALGSATGDQDDALFVSDIGSTDLSGSLLFTVGCHSGLSVGENLPGPLGADWAEALGAAGASAYLAQTGFGYGSTDSIQLTERLLVAFAGRLDGNFTIGEALKLAKNDYVRPLASISVYDEKSLQQAVLFGLPFSTPAVADPPDRGGAPTDLVAVPTTIAGLSTATLRADFDIDRQERDRGTVFEIDGGSYAPQAQPLQPIISLDSTVANSSLRGALLRGGNAYRVEGLIDPIYQTPTIDSSEREPEVQPVDALFPLSPLSVTDSITEFGRRDSTVIQPGRFQATEPDGRGLQFLYDDLLVQTLHSSSPDWTPPRIGQVTQRVVNGVLSVTIDSSDGDVAGAVVALVENLPNSSSTAPAVWRSFDLQSGGNGRWSGAIPLSTSCTEQVDYLVQIYDTAGNVDVMSNKAAGFTSSCADDPTPPPTDGLTATPDTPPGPSGWYSGPVTIRVGSTLPGAVSYRIDGGAPTPLVGDTFLIAGPGVRSYSVTSAGSSALVSATVLIDDGTPTATIVSPGAADVYTGDEVLVVFSCGDVSLTSCTGQLTGPGGSVSVQSGDTIVPTLGLYTLTVTAVDALGNPAVAIRSLRAYDRPLVFEGFFAPVAPDDPTDPQVLNVVRAGQAVPLKWRIYKADGTLVTSTAGIDVRHRFVACDAGAPQDETDWTLAPSVGGGLKFADGQFQFNLKTQKAWARRCGVVTITYGDLNTHGSLQTAEVLFKYR